MHTLNDFYQHIVTFLYRGKERYLSFLYIVNKYDTSYITI